MAVHASPLAPADAAALFFLALPHQVIVKAMIKDGKIAKWSYYGESARCASIFVDGVEGISK